MTFFSESVFSNLEVTEIQFCQGGWDRLTEIPMMFKIHAKKILLLNKTLLSVTKP